MKKVLFIRSNPVSPDSRVEKEAAALAEGGYEVNILAWDREKEYSLRLETIDIESQKIEIYRIGILSQFHAGFKKNLIPLMRFQLAIIKFIAQRGNEYDIIHACDFDTAFSASLLRKVKKYKLVYDLFDYYVDSFSVPGVLKAVVESLDIRTMNKADGVIICTEDRKKQICKASPKRIEIIHNSPYFYNSGLGKNINKNKTIKVVYVGVLTQNRGILELCKYVAKHNDFELHIGGFGILENDVKQFADRFSNIVFYGKIPYVQTLQLEDSCDIITAIYDPMVKNHIYAAPNKFYEGLMLGKPLLMIEGSGMSSIVKDQRIGAVVPYDQIGEGLEQIKNMRNQWADMAEREKILYESNYSWCEMKKRLIKLYSNI